MLRIALENDTDSLYQLISEMENRQLPYQKFKQIFQNQLKDDNYICLVYEKENEIVGCINLRLEEQLHHADKTAEILEMAVKEGYRSCGIGKQLISGAIELAKEKNCIVIEVSSNQVRINAHRFYEREGLHKTHYKLTKKL